MRRALSLLSFGLAFTFAPAAAGADGLPVPVDGAETASVAAPDGDGPRYATVSNGRRTTLLQIDRDGGEILGSRTIDGEYSIPLVSIDGTPSGISGDGSRLVLIHPRQGLEFPRDESSFVVVDIVDGRMRPQPPLTLRGDFSFDALSPDGLSLFLIEYTSTNYNDYAVREYDLANHRLLPDPVLVAHEVSPGEMRGLPMTRASSPDGAWEFTLYDGGGGRGDTPFIHTLDTERGISHCIDLPMLDGNQAWRAGFDLADDGTLNVTRGAQTVAMLDTDTFALTEPLAPELTATTEGGDGIPGGVVIGASIAAITLLVGAAVGLRRRRSRAALPPDPFASREPEAERERVST
jgi:hypothetical protein